MIIWIFFGHLMTPEQHQTTEDSQRSGSGKSEVIACINNQLKQRSENQRVRGSIPWDDPCGPSTRLVGCDARCSGRRAGL
jgi:hypothetical protein